MSRRCPSHLFEANDGQFAADVKYCSRGPGYGFFLKPTEAVMTVTAGGSDERTSSTVTMRFVGASDAKAIEPVE